ncbi:MAG: VOC family protein [Rhodospirillaceae bacterium]|nr:VOC family protein [Rhodospirillaceae bacterium]
MARSTSADLGVQGLGWVVRRYAAGPNAIVPFYQSALGLRQLRPPGPTGAVMLWAGDIVMLEVSGLSTGPDSAARQGDMTVIMRVRDFGRAKAMMTAAGAQQVGESLTPAKTVMFADPAGLRIGLREAIQASSLQHDVIANDIWRKGVITLPNAPSLPPDVQDIAAIGLKVVDPVAMAAFYADLFGFATLGEPNPKGAALWLGRTTALELSPGGIKHAVPADRDQVPDVWIARVYDHDALAKRLADKKVPIVTQRQITGGKLTYAADPEGRLFGIQQRTPDLLPPDAKERVEDVLARDLWAADAR